MGGSFNEASVGTGAWFTLGVSVNYYLTDDSQKGTWVKVMLTDISKNLQVTNSLRNPDSVQVLLNCAVDSDYSCASFFLYQLAIYSVNMTEAAFNHISIGNLANHCSHTDPPSC
jgi:hypothetical protein